MAFVTILDGITVPADKHELNLSGRSVVEAVNTQGFHKEFFQLKHLNYLSISAGLENLSPDFGKLIGLTSLVLHGNCLQTLPVEIGNLTELKHLDVSFNALKLLPETLSNISNLSSINLSMNALSFLPSFRQNLKLACLNASNNKLENFPDCCYPQLSSLSEILLSSNLISCIPNDIGELQALKTLDISCNQISEVPPGISLIKLKDLNLKSNDLKDKRLKKMVEQCHSKKVIDYIKHNIGKQTGCHAERKELLRLSCSENKENKIATIVDTDTRPKYIIGIMKPVNDEVEVHVSSSVKGVRAGIVCCVIRDISFTIESFQKFIQFQNKFHDTVCDKRKKASVGTHDLKPLKLPLKYVVHPPTEITMVPLGSSEPCTAADFVANKKLEAIKLRKEKKRTGSSGISQYLALLEGCKDYPFLMDADNQVLSLPPVTNCEISKISVDTKDMLIEVTSGSDKKVIREVMDRFIKDLVAIGIINNKGSNYIEENFDEIIIVEQVTMVPEKGRKTHYPFDTDLNFAPSSNFLRKTINI